MVKTGKIARNKVTLEQIYSKKQKREYFRNLNIKDLNDDKKVWRKIEPFFSNEGLETNNIIFKEKNELITDSSTLLIYSITTLLTLQVL